MTAPQRPARVRSPLSILLSTTVGALLLAGACSGNVEIGSDDPLAAGGSAANSGSGGLGLGGTEAVVGGGGADSACVRTACRGHYYACGDCQDNDADGLIDSADPACLGPCDDDELGLSTGLTESQSAACRQDCYFDGDAGPGNDKCTWSHACDPLSVAPDYPPSGEVRCAYDPVKQMGIDCAAAAAKQDAACLAACLPLVPNGCDCFGCCQLPDGAYHFIGRGRGEAGCQLDHLDDAAACPHCTPVDSCWNDCAPCETCVGKVPAASCQGAGHCPDGERSCDSNADCELADYCVTGCCVRAPPPT